MLGDDNRVSPETCLDKDQCFGYVCLWHYRSQERQPSIDILLQAMINI
jgi:hypothetical protein